MLTRYGGDGGHLFGWGLGVAYMDYDLAILGIMTSAGYLFIVVVAIVGMALGDKAQVQNFLFNVFGFLFFISIGSCQIDAWSSDLLNGKYKDMALSMGSMAIITSIVFLVDTVFSALGIMKNDS